MRVLLLGKSNILFWLEHLYDAFLSINGVVVKKVATNKIGFPVDICRGLLKAFNKDIAGRYMQDVVEKEIKNFDPDLMVVISPFVLNRHLMQALEVARKSCVRVGWVGDRFKKEQIDLKPHVDILCCSDTGIMQEASEFGFEDIRYLPFAANEKIYNNKNLNRENTILFVGAPTKERLNILKQIPQDIRVKLIGKMWKDGFNDNFIVNPKNISAKEVAAQYNRSDFVLNIRQRANNINGLNMRSFEAPACGTCLLQEHLEDMHINFEIGKEVVVFKTTEELVELSSKLNRDKKLLRDIQDSGCKRVISEHLYKHRAMKILNYDTD